MAQNSKIEWCHHTANLWWGCTKVHEGCDNCYAETLSKRWNFDVWGNDKPRRAIKSVWNDLSKYQKLAKEAGEIHRVFVGSMMDIFEKPMPMIDSKGNPVSHPIMGKDDPKNELGYSTGDERNFFFAEITNGSYPNLMFLLLTKRPSNINKYIPESWKENPPANVMFGTSPVNQQTADKLIEQLLQVNGKKFLSCEPMLGELSLKKWIGYFGGEYYICSKKYNEKGNGFAESVSGCIGQGIGDNSGRGDLENSKKGLGSMEQYCSTEQVQENTGGTRYRGIFNDTSNVQSEKINDRSAQVDLLPFQGRDTKGNDSQPQKRRQERQPSKQSGVNDGQGTDAPCQNSIESGDTSTGRGKELDVEINASAGIGNNFEKEQRGAAKEDCTGLRDRIPARFEIGEGATLAKDFWVIQGGESGHHKRHFNLDWAYSMKEQCAVAGIPYFFKQIDKVKPIPEDLMVRQFPITNVKE